MQIELYDEQEALNSQQKQMLVDLLSYAAQKLKLEDEVEMSISLVDNVSIQSINRDYRQKDQVTDVISFALEEEGEGELFIDFEAFDFPRQLGDIFISFEKAQEQAHTYQHSLERELGFLAVHGFLHLNGYDHQNREEEKEMFALQEDILEEFGLER